MCNAACQHTSPVLPGLYAEALLQGRCLRDKRVCKAKLHYITHGFCHAVGVFCAYLCSMISKLVPAGPREAFLEVTLKVGPVHSAFSPGLVWKRCAAVKPPTALP